MEEPPYFQYSPGSGLLYFIQRLDDSESTWEVGRFSAPATKLLIPSSGP